MMKNVNDTIHPYGKLENQLRDETESWISYLVDCKICWGGILFLINANIRNQMRRELKELNNYEDYN